MESPHSMNHRREHFFHWPGWSQLGFAVALGLLETALFAAIYLGADWITSRHSYRLRIHTTWDLAVPFFASASVSYLSLNLMFWMTPFVLRTRNELIAFTKTLAMATVLAGIGFLLIPAEAGFPPVDVDGLGFWQGPYSFARALARTHNYVPSLHVTFTIICVRVMARQAPPTMCGLLWGWGTWIVLSTMLLHQHYLLDVLTGAMLGWLVVTYGYDGWLAPAQRSTAEKYCTSLASDREPLA